MIRQPRIRQDYWIRYGATLLGLMRHHGTDPDHFLWHTHQFPDLKRMVVFERPVIHALRRLPGRKIVFSNAPRHYTAAILAITGLGCCFDAVYSVESVRYPAQNRCFPASAPCSGRNASTRAAASWSRTAWPISSPPRNSA